MAARFIRKRTNFGTFDQQMRISGSFSVAAGGAITAGSSTGLSRGWSVSKTGTGEYSVVVADGTPINELLCAQATPRSLGTLWDVGLITEWTAATRTLQIFTVTGAVATDATQATAIDFVIDIRTSDAP